MKKIVEIIISLVLAIIGIIAVVFLALNIFKSSNTLPKIADIASYYDESYPILLDNLKHQVGNEKLQVIVESVVTKDRVKEDILKIFNNGDKVKDEIGEAFKVDFLDSLKSNLDEPYEEEALLNLVDLVSDSYKESLFPYDEYSLVYKVINKVPFITPIFIGMLVLLLVLSIVLLIFAKNGYRIVAISDYITGLLLLFPYLFVTLGGIISKFYYTNQYWTLFIKKTIVYLLKAFAIAGIIFIVLGIIVQIMEKTVKKDGIK